MARGRKRALGDVLAPPPMTQVPLTPTSKRGFLLLSSTSQSTPLPAPPMTQDPLTPASAGGLLSLPLQPSSRAATHITVVFQERFNGPLLQLKRYIWDPTYSMTRMNMAWESKAKNRLRDLLGDARGKNKRPSWIDERYWAEIWNAWNTPTHIAQSERNKWN
ncbi:hypothetical protein M9H77_08588 [Catharanthus roseus]|uniref:Uncharacterized protein n=1 Tax=Catharanthus roseus TaxID=4058 RepID=A0ACC0BYM5_CATRO|nr:hypothetical protein M9H77_08588 [Catharanthus roseus]